MPNSAQNFVAFLLRSNKNVAPRHFFSIIRIMLQRSKVGIYRAKAQKDQVAALNNLSLRPF
jgi:hypothetical protein